LAITGISIHIVGASLDVPAAGMRIACEVIICAGAFFAAQGVAPATPALLDRVPFRSNVFAPNQHVHLHMNFTR
jgi:hypothetical protein